MPNELALLEEVVLGSARGGRKLAAPLQIEVVRALTPDDLPLLINPPPSTGPKQSAVQEMRHGHHLLARTLAEGHSQEEASLITGYSPAYISTMKGSPAFEELLAYYQQQKELIFVDVMERMKALGLSGLDELQSRLAKEPDRIAFRELLELVETTLVKGRTPQAQQPGTGGPGVVVNVKFVSAKAKDEAVDMGAVVEVK